MERIWRQVLDMQNGKGLGHRSELRGKGKSKKGHNGEERPGGGKEEAGSRC